MADAVDVIVIANNPNRYVIRCTNRSDGTGESNVIKADKSTLVGLLGWEPSKLNLEWVQWSIQGFTSVQAAWDHTTDDEMIIMGTGNGQEDFTINGPLVDPGSAGGTGDVLFTTFNNISNASYNIVMSFKKSGSVIV